MGFESVALFGLLDVELEATLQGSLAFSTDLPSNSMAVRETKTIPPTGRRVLRFRLLPTTKGHLYSLKISPGLGVIRLYGARVWARVLPGSEWTWYTVPLPDTSEWTPAKIPIPPMGEWDAAKIPIPPTSEWAEAKQPIKPTPQNFEWVDIPVDQ